MTWKDRETDRQTNRQTNSKQTDRQTANKQTDRQTANKQTNKQSDQQTDKQTNRQTNSKQTNRQVLLNSRIALLNSRINLLNSRIHNNTDVNTLLSIIAPKRQNSHQYGRSRCVHKSLTLTIPNASVHAANASDCHQPANASELRQTELHRL